MTTIHPGDTVTVTIGRNVPADSQWALFGNGDPVRPMTRSAWNAFKMNVEHALRYYLQADKLFVFEGENEWDGEVESSACFVALCDLERRVDPLEQILRDYCTAYSQEAIGLAIGPGTLVTA
jgi:hypothetical protein